MKKINSKGFTLIELLAVIAILIIISTIAISSISSAVERNKVKQNDAKKAVIVSYGKLYFEKNRNKYTENRTYCINITDLKELSEDEKKDADGTLFIGYVKVENPTKPTFTFVEECP